MDAFLEKLRVDVMKYCIKHKLSIRQFLLQINENGLSNWYTLFRRNYQKNGQIGLLLKLIKYFDYDK